MYKKEHFLKIMEPVHGTWSKKAYSKLSRKMSTLVGSLKRRSLEYEVKFRITSNQIRTMFYKSYNKPCKYCEVPLNLRNIACDHIVPLSKGGDSVVKNLQLICKSCNTRKGPLDEEDFITLMMLVNDLPDEISSYVKRKLAKGGRY